MRERPPLCLNPHVRLCVGAEDTDSQGGQVPCKAGDRSLMARGREAMVSSESPHLEWRKIPNVTLNEVSHPSFLEEIEVPR